MGTRSTTKIYDEDKLLLALYKQFDGYPESGWGDELKDFIKSGKFVNGINDRSERVFNGMGCFALQLVAKYKTEAGDLYATTEKDSQEFNYIIRLIGERGKRRYVEIACEEEPSFYEKISVGVF